MRNALCVLCFVVAGIAVGCTPRTDSILTPGEQVTRAELAVEVESVEASHERAMLKAKKAEADIMRQEIRNAEIKSIAAEIASGGISMALSGGATAGGAVGLGLFGAAAAGLGVALRKAKQNEAVGGVVVQAVESLRQNPETKKNFEDALKAVLAKASLSEADYNKAIALLKEKANQ